MSNFEAINRFFYFSQNYKSDYYKWKNMWGEDCSGVYPCFLMEVDWTCNRDHIISKWNGVESQNSWGRVNQFYAELDTNNRQRLIDYAMEKF